MILSMRWLHDFVDIDQKPRAFSHAMTMSGSKVEGYETEGNEIDKVVVGRVLEVRPHENSDHLVICKIDAAQAEDLQIVTGASNVVPGAMVPVALDGSTLPGGKKIKRGKLRGELSEGMLCSLSELGLTLHDFPYAVEDGIFLIEEECSPGQDIREALGFNDTCVEFEITPNRPDCLSVIGLARETAATYRLPLKLPKPLVKGSGGDISEYISVSVENTTLCPRYTCRVIKNVKIAPSPRWMRERLRASGVRPINNLVDITNYVMLEYGQPLHAFDASLISDKQIIVRNAKEGEAIRTLDGTERKLAPDMLVIADPKKAIAVAGVMGGENSAILDSTNTVILESANFMGKSVRLTSKKLGLRTDASSRYEKGLDAQNCMNAANRACQLIEELGAGEVVDGSIDVDHSGYQQTRIYLDPDWINQFLGIKLSREEMEEILKSLYFEIDGDEVIPPSFRSDIENKADIAEEIARLYGYDKIPTTSVKGVADAKLSKRQLLERCIHQTLQASGCFEVTTYSFISPKYYDKLTLPENSPLRKSVVITNPLGEDTSVMRSTVFPSMLEVLSHNYNHKTESFSAYEIANEYHPKESGELPDECTQVILGSYGKDKSFFHMKGIIEVLLERLHVRGWEMIPMKEDPVFHPGRTAQIFKGDTLLGIVGEVHPSVLENFSMGEKAYLAKLDLTKLELLSDSHMEYKQLPRFPAVTRDLSLICDEEMPIVQIEKAIQKSAGELLETLKLFDVYKGSQIDENKKSVSYKIVLRSATGTMTDAEADATVNRILNELTKIGVSLRS